MRALAGGEWVDDDDGLRLLGGDVDTCGGALVFGLSDRSTRGVVDRILLGLCDEVAPPFASVDGRRGSRARSLSTKSRVRRTASNE